MDVLVNKKAYINTANGNLMLYMLKANQTQTLRLEERKNNESKSSGKGRKESFSDKLGSKITDKANFKYQDTFKSNVKEYFRTKVERFKNDLRIGLLRDVDTLKAIKNRDVKKLLDLDLNYPKTGGELENIGKNDKELNKIAPYQSTIAKDAVLLTRFGLDNRSAQQAALIIDRDKAIERGRVYKAMKEASASKS